MPPNPSHDRQIILLAGIVAAVLLLAALGLYLIQNPAAPLPWEKPTASPTITLPPTVTGTTTPTITDTPTRRVSYTPRLPTNTPQPSETATPTTIPTTQVIPTATTAPTFTHLPPTNTPEPTRTRSAHTKTPTLTQEASTPTGTTAADTATPTATLPSGTVQVGGRMLVNGAPVVQGVLVKFEIENVTTLTTTTDANGYYTFTMSVNSGFNFAATFDQSKNEQFYPGEQITLWAWIAGLIPAPNITAKLPDLEISLTPGGNTFQPLTPANGASVSVEPLSSTNPLRFEWNAYPQADRYWFDLTLDGQTETTWQSTEVTTTYFNFNGKVTPTEKISPGNYHWSVGALQYIDTYTVYAYSHPFSLIFTP